LIHKRGFYGMLLDRFSDGLGSILVVGDLLQDVDGFYSVVKERDGYPCLKLERTETRPGGAGAVAEMVRALGVDCLLACDSLCVSSKRRIIADGEVLCRQDYDKHSTAYVDLPPADLVLVADYNKGVVTDSLMRRVAKQYAGKEIIVDSSWGRLHGATAIKSSQPYGREHEGRPFILTRGRFGLHAWCDGEKFDIPSPDVHALDPCGAGDMVLATLGVARLRGLSWREACEWAVRNASEVCREWGAVPPKAMTNAPSPCYP
jgi:bifunctional ADP-heptose synthase (sugar kinase/adenylyltransferase)